MENIENINSNVESIKQSKLKRNLIISACAVATLALSLGLGLGLGLKKSPEQLKREQFIAYRNEFNNQIIKNVKDSFLNGHDWNHYKKDVMKRFNNVEDNLDINRNWYDGFVSWVMTDQDKKFIDNMNYDPRKNDYLTVGNIYISGDGVSYLANETESRWFFVNKLWVATITSNSAYPTNETILNQFSSPNVIINK